MMAQKHVRATFALSLSLVVAILGSPATATHAACPTATGQSFGPEQETDLTGVDDFATSPRISGTKPQSKLWFDRGYWWSIMWDKADQRFEIFRLDNPTTASWTSTNVPVHKMNGSSYVGDEATSDNRYKRRYDALLDPFGPRVYIGAHRFTEGTPGTCSPSCGMYLFRYTPVTVCSNSLSTVCTSSANCPIGGQCNVLSYSLDTSDGFPQTIVSNIKVEALTIAKAQNGIMWATWTQKGTTAEGGVVKVNRTYGNCAGFPPYVPVGSSTECAFNRTGMPYIIATGLPTGSSWDDISAIVSFQSYGDDGIGVMWSNHNTEAIHYAYHQDSDVDTVWTQELAYGGTGTAGADDHINLTADSNGRILAVVKTSKNDFPSIFPPTDPQMLLLVRSAYSECDLGTCESDITRTCSTDAECTGNWYSSVFGTIAENPTRGVSMLQEYDECIHVVATNNNVKIIEKTATLPVNGPHTVTFGSSRTLIDGGTRKLNDVTTTKQQFRAGVDNYLAILASEYEFADDDGSYWHYTQCINASCP